MLYLGTVTPKQTQWELFPNPSINGKFLRITFQAVDGLPLEGMRSFLLLRRYWSVTTPPTVNRAFKVYPTNSATIIHTPISQDFQDLGLVVCDWQCKIGWRYRHTGLSEIVYTVSLEEG